MVSALLSLGSNLGDREQYLRSGIISLSQHQVEVTRRAGIYETEPRDVTDQPWFLNTVVQVNTDLRARELLNVCLSIERENHRIRGAAKSARTLDIDIIFYGQQVVQEPGLIIPHPRFSERNFVLIPLAEIAADFTDPLTGLTIDELLRCSQDRAIVRPLQ